MFVVQNDLFGNLIWIFFFLPDHGIFFFQYLLYHRTQTFVPWILAVENSREALFFKLEEEENHGLQLFLIGPSQQKFNFKIKTYPPDTGCFQ